MCLDFACSTELNVSQTTMEIDTITYLLEKGRPTPLRSCDGEPAPDRVAPDILPPEVTPLGKPKGDLKEVPVVGSVGELLAEGEPDRGWRMAEGGRYPSVG